MLRMGEKRDKPAGPAQGGASPINPEKIFDDHALVAELPETSAPLLETLSDGLLVVDSDDRVRQWRGEAAAQLGGSESPAGQPVTDLVPTEIGEKLSEGLRQARQRREPRQLDCYQDQFHRWYRLRLVPSGEGDEVVAAVYEISSDKATHHQLQSRWRQQAALAELTQDALGGQQLARLLHRACQMVADFTSRDLVGVLRLEADGQLSLQAGEGFAADLIGETIDPGANSQAGYTLQREQPVVAEDLAAESRFDVPGYLRHHTARTGASVVVRGAGGEPWGVLAGYSTRGGSVEKEEVRFIESVAEVLATAMERERWEGELRREGEWERQQAELLRSSLEGVPAVVLIAHDPNGDHITGSREAHQLFRMPPGSNLARLSDHARHYTFYQGQEPAPVEALPLRRALRGEAVQDWRGTLVFEEGARHELIGRAVPLLDAHQHVTGAVAVFQQITEQEKEMERLRQLNRTLEQRVAERTSELEERTEQLRLLRAELTQVPQQERQRVAQIVHDDLQRLLLAARRRVENLNGGEGEPAGTGDEAEEAEHLLERAIRLARRLASETAPPVLYQAGLGPALHWLSRQMEKEHLPVSVEADETIHQPDDQTRSLVFRSVRELLGVMAGADHGEAHLRLAQEETRLRLTITGPAAEGLDCDRLTGESGGENGEGPVVSLQWLRLAGADVAYEKDGDETVAISLSLALPRPAEAELSSGPVQAARVLLVDDHKIVREGLRSLLESQPDVEVVGESVSGEEAIELTRQLEPDVVLMDVSLPHVSGIEATRRLTEQVPSAKVIALSVHEAADVASAMYAAGAVSYVSKAGPGDELLRAVRRVRSMS